jgi:hypothetical protein
MRRVRFTHLTDVLVASCAAQQTHTFRRPYPSPVCGSFPAFRQLSTVWNGRPTSAATVCGRR